MSNALSAGQLAKSVLEVPEQGEDKRDSPEAKYVRTLYLLARTCLSLGKKEHAAEYSVKQLAFQAKQGKCFPHLPLFVFNFQLILQAEHTSALLHKATLSIPLHEPMKYSSLLYLSVCLSVCLAKRQALFLYSQVSVFLA